MKPIISKNIRVRHLDLFEVEEDSIVDDFSYFSTRMVVGRGSHIASGCTIAGGRERTFRLGDYSGVASGCRILCASSNFVTGLVTITPPGFGLEEWETIEGDVTFENYTGVGANSIVMPSNTIPEGTVIGGLSFVPSGYPFEPWTVYVGVPVRKVKLRDRNAVMRQLERIHKFLNNKEG